MIELPTAKRPARRAMAFACSAIFAASCNAQPAPASTGSPAAFAPTSIRSLRQFGAVGDGRADDTAALQRAFAQSGAYCLDGQQRQYRVTGTLTVDRNLCLRNATLVQSLAPYDTSRLITRDCPFLRNAAGIEDCGDPVVPASELAALRRSLGVRTLLIRKTGRVGDLRVTLDHVTIDRGRYPDLGSRTDSAGIYLQGADRADINNVEIRGYGKGAGLLVSRSNNINVDNLYIHDLVWAPYRGDPALTEARVESIGWNLTPIHEFREAGQNGVAAAKFYGVRVQEQIRCATFAEVQHVRIRNLRISRCLARFDTGDLPWQADGLDISRSSSDVIVDGATIDSTWEGIDVVGNGTGITGLQIRNVRASNSFGYGIKLGKHLRDARVSGLDVRNSGISGIVVYGGIDGINVTGSVVNGVGLIVTPNGRRMVPWPKQIPAGVRIGEGKIEQGEHESPRRVAIQNLDVTNGSQGGRPGVMILNVPGVPLSIIGARGEGGIQNGPVRRNPWERRQ